MTSASSASSRADRLALRGEPGDDRADHPEPVAVREVAHRLVAGHQRARLGRDGGKPVPHVRVQGRQPRHEVRLSVGHVHAQLADDGRQGLHDGDHGDGVHPEGGGRRAHARGQPSVLGLVGGLRLPDLAQRDVIGGLEDRHAVGLRLLEGTVEAFLQVQAIGHDEVGAVDRLQVACRG